MDNHEVKLCEQIAERSKSKIITTGLNIVLDDERNVKAKNQNKGCER